MSVALDLIDCSLELWLHHHHHQQRQQALRSILTLTKTTIHLISILTTLLFSYLPTYYKLIDLQQDGKESQDSTRKEEGSDPKAAQVGAPSSSQAFGYGGMLS